MSNATRSNVTDNDGLWTHTYLASLCFCYAVTKDEEVLKAARRTKDAGLFLTRAPEIKGFTARAVRFPDERKWGVGLGEKAYLVAGRYFALPFEISTAPASVPRNASPFSRKVIALILSSGRMPICLRLYQPSL